MSRFFIDRPIFAWVLAIVVMLAGALSITTLSISQYPQIAPTTVRITANYPGADAETVENSVTKVIEQGMTAIDNLDYITSNSTATGQASITLTFTNAADADVAQMQVQNNLQLVEARLPQVVRNTGITVSKSTSSFFMIASFVSTDGSQTGDDLADFIDTSLNDTLRRVPGVGDTQIFGSRYAMRIWVDPDKLAKYQLIVSDVTNAIEAQNTQVSAGQLGALPQKTGQQLNASITAGSRLQTKEEFEAIILKSENDGALVQLKDIATVELGAESYTRTGVYNGKSAAGIGFNLTTDANAIDTADAIRAAIERERGSFPANVEVEYPYDTTPFVRLSIEGVIQTLIEAVILVFLVMFLFLQNLRATLIPTLAVPVVLLGTFGVLALFGYSINTLTMFGMVLAIGLLVDDAIVVVENVERVMEEEGLGPREATIKSMGEISGALVGITTVLSAVFVPMAFFSGSVGVIYRQFSITIVTAMILSVLVALVLTPALCATILRKPKHHTQKPAFFRWFNRNFERGTQFYRRGVNVMIKRMAISIMLFFTLVAGIVALLDRLPTAFLPQEDQGRVIATIQLPAGATADRTRRVLDTVIQHFLTEEKDYVNGVFGSVGFNFSGQGQNVALAFISLKDFDQRTTPESTAQAIVGRAMRAFGPIRDARVVALNPPPIPGFGNSAGFDFFIRDTEGAGHDALMAARNQLLGLAGQNDQLTGTRPNGQEDTPQYSVSIDRGRASALGLNLSDIDATLSTAWGGTYVNDFIDRGRVKRVYVQSQADFRMQPEDFDRWYVRNNRNEMVPFSAFATGKWTYGSPRLERYNGASAVQIQGAGADGTSSGEAMSEIERMMEQLPPEFTHEWTSLSAQERLAGNQAIQLYAISVFVVFLALAALYESWSVPLSVMLAVPVGIFGALAAATLFEQANDVYFKVGLLTTIGLAAKNAILIVEFAIAQQQTGKSLLEATLEASRQRLRPILMTSFAFILGVLPLAIATGAGSGSQNSIGIGVMGGMISATFLGIFFIPVLFFATRRVFKGKSEPSASTGQSGLAAPAE
ncbi:MULTISPECIES: efflux RND transporter permease subunit [unclassified Agrobacterium]|uniref:efflux RND transporter permease subunit n=1 Tax=unclassified Agrobacterium TaxID=2632611 RepID=UPI0024498788|nr:MULTISPECIES: efflux RND transporter permease subunit [unclassified Agrobacterium]MDH0617028.1 efflux RND transporter permease subunit [Agrobacterium sp. GD03872]MDH0699786.1 efflux RND transporter permease subunit [Agrobacterium sp. GD03871]MDH1061020.1 efflux RND transporter permease subunit [Agrobacterium sp. GD03992]MDH2211564.1 efflux RND transporter permease subunit [Agrobacterium sp. GD03643]MDH2221189.1 efflux RND transporter permease subunit [Agrobacterium sp. GD03638]